MSKNRRRNNQKGAKSIAIRTKFKIGGRKSGRGAHQMTNAELNHALAHGRPKDRNSIMHVMRIREDRLWREMFGVPTVYDFVQNGVDGN
jgi:hypothetical protein